MVLALVSAWFTPLPVASGDPPPPARFEVSARTVDEDDLRGKLISLSSIDGLELETTANDTIVIPVADLVRLTMVAGTSEPRERAVRRERERSDAAARRHHTLTLTNDDVLYGDLLAADGENVALETLDAGRLVFPLGSIARIEAPRADQPMYHQAATWLGRQTDDDEDRVLLTNGDVLRGLIKSVGDDGLVILGDAGETRIPVRLMVAVRFASSDVSLTESTREESDILMTLIFRESGRLTVEQLDWSGRAIRTKTPGGETLHLEARRVLAVAVSGGRWEWLSEHRPISFEHTPMLALPWDYEMDRNVLGGPIRVAGETIERGIGVHSRSRLTFDLKGQYQSFVTYFGMDDSCGPLANVSVTVFVDGRPRFEQDPVEPGRLFGPVRLDVTRARTLELLVDFGANGDMQDRFNWVEPALIRP